MLGLKLDEEVHETMIKRSATVAAIESEIGQQIDKRENRNMAYLKDQLKNRRREIDRITKAYKEV